VTALLRTENGTNAREVARTNMPAWVLGHLDLSSVTTALDVGAGWGRVGRPLLERAGAPREPGIPACPGVLSDHRRRRTAAGRTLGGLEGRQCSPEAPLCALPRAIAHPRRRCDHRRRRHLPRLPPGLPVPRAHPRHDNNSVIATVRPATKQAGPQSSRNKGSTPASQRSEPRSGSPVT
jgi:hypothetical protein